MLQYYRLGSDRDYCFLFVPFLKHFFLFCSFSLEASLNEDLRLSMSNDPDDMDDEKYAWRLPKDTKVNPRWASHLSDHSQSRANNGLRGPSASDVSSLTSSSQNSLDGTTDRSSRDDTSTTSLHSEGSTPRSSLDHHHHHRRRHPHRHHIDDNNASSSSLPESQGGSRPRTPVSLPSDLTDTANIWNRNDPDEDDDTVISQDTTAAVRMDDVVVPERQRQPYWGRRHDPHITVEEEVGDTSTTTVYSVSERQRQPHSFGHRQDTITTHTSQQQPYVFDYLEEPPNAGLPPPAVARDPWHNAWLQEKNIDDACSNTSQSSSTVVELPGHYVPAELPPSSYHRDAVPPFMPGEKGHQPRPSPPRVVRFVSPPASPPPPKTTHNKEKPHTSTQRGGQRNTGGDQHGEKKKKEHKKKKDSWPLRFVWYAATT